MGIKTYLSNTPIEEWDISNIVCMTHIFHGANSFNQYISNWIINSDCDTRDIFGNNKDWNRYLKHKELIRKHNLKYVIDKGV